MSQAQKIVVLGASLLMQMVADGLAKMADVEVIHLNPLTADALAQVKQIQPDVVIVEWSRRETAVADHTILELLYHHPGLYILGVDTSQPVTYRLHSDRLPTNTIQELVQELAVWQRPCPESS